MIFKVREQCSTIIFFLSSQSESTLFLSVSFNKHLNLNDWDKDFICRSSKMLYILRSRSTYQFGFSFVFFVFFSESGQNEIHFDLTGNDLKPVMWFNDQVRSVQISGKNCANVSYMIGAGPSRIFENLTQIKYGWTVLPFLAFSGLSPRNAETPMV